MATSLQAAELMVLRAASCAIQATVPEGGLNGETCWRPKPPKNLLRRNPDPRRLRLPQTISRLSESIVSVRVLLDLRRVFRNPAAGDFAQACRRSAVRGVQ